MGDNFIFWKLSATHKKWFVIHQILLFFAIALMTFIAIKTTNPVIAEKQEKVSIAIGVIVGCGVMGLAMLNRLKKLLKVKFLLFAIVWILLVCFNAIMDTIIWTVGLVLIPLMIDDLILLPIWRNIWYNNYEQ